MRYFEYVSPLRYPGGKSSLTYPISQIIAQNDLKGCRFYEVYAGGSGISLNLLFKGEVSDIFINDADYRIYAFWDSVLNNTDSLITKILEIKLSIDEWHQQKEIYENIACYSNLEIGFATLFLNRTNRSGVLSSAGPIGGYEQKGKYKLGARFYKKTLTDRIEKISKNRQFIHLSNKDAIDFLKEVYSLIPCNKKCLFFLDPPYFEQGARLYLNFYKQKDHKNLSEFLRLHNNKNWIVTYDNVDEIKNMYDSNKTFEFDLNYQMNGPKIGKELIILSDKIKTPSNKWLICQ